MKTLIKSLAFAVTLAFATTSATLADDITTRTNSTAATSSFKVGIYTAVDGKLVVMLDKQPGSYVDIHLKNAKGQSAFLQRVGKKDLKTRMKLNLNALEDGDYTVLISNGTETTTHQLTLSTPQPSTPARSIQVK